MNLKRVVLEGSHVRLEPLRADHTDALVEAANEDPSLYQWTFVPQDRESMEGYVSTALATRDAGQAEPFAIIRQLDGKVIGCSRFFDLERWAWPVGHPRHGRSTLDVGEIGYTWLARSAIRTGVNSETKLLLLSHAFEVWDAVRICFHTDVRNVRSRTALAGIGAREEGILRGHRMGVDFVARDSPRFSILASEWPEVKAKLVERIRKHGG